MSRQLNNLLKVETKETTGIVETPQSPPQVRRSNRRTKDAPAVRYGSVTSRRVDTTIRLRSLMRSLSKKIDLIYYHVF